MANGLPFFKFEAAEWLAGRISLEPFDVQGAYITICCIYWQKLSEINQRDARLRIGSDLLTTLIDKEFIDLDGEYISIKWLDVQLDERRAVSEKRRQAGAKGGVANAKNKLANATKKVANAKQMPSKSKQNRIEENRIEENRIEKGLLPALKLTILEEWLDYRKQIKKPITNGKTIDKLVDKFKQTPPAVIKKAVNYSIENGYQGLFWDKFTVGNNKPTDHNGIKRGVI